MRGPKPKYPDPRLRELWHELEADPDLAARDAACRVVGRHDPRPAGAENRARHLMRLAAKELHRPGPTDLVALFLWERVTREGQRGRRRFRARLELRQAKERAARRRWGGVYFRWHELEPVSAMRHLHSDDESVEDFLASLDWRLKSYRDLFR